jgi:hypothetical protein
MSAEARPKWDEHIQVVFSVLAGLSFAEAFNVLASAGFGLTETFLSIAVFYIVFDNWYYLHKDLTVIDVESELEIGLYLLSLMTYACLPYLYGVNSKLNGGFDPPTWMLINLLLICFVDAIRKTVTLANLRKNKNFSNSEKKLAGAYVFYSLTGYFYTIILLLATSFSLSITIEVYIKAILVVVLWFAIRIIDIVLIPRTSNLMVKIFLGETASSAD